ncbi:DNA repair protein RAD51-like 3-like [Gigaspora margarita]|uniref:DNA repair protein RAD51 homolog 3 n=1 Tax=Gigaspora margarita TaxID=4874 RepID=A0A8H4EII9_GIGMA|nr:DNA repair protein RAD51-like 3-like [Gigaspora margarita]
MRDARSILLVKLNIKPGQIKKLHDAGYKFLEDLKEASPLSLSKDIGVSVQEALSIIRQIKNDKLPSASLTSIIKRETYAIPTFCNGIDKLLGGKGVTLGKIVEFCGIPGIGKTQMGIQLSINVQIPRNLFGPEGEAVYIEGSFIIQRVAEIANGTIARLNETVEGSPFNLETILSRIYYFRIHDYIQLNALIKNMDEFLNEHPMVKLIVIDSIAFHFRTELDLSVRTRVLQMIAQKLEDIAESFELAVVLMNQMTTKFGGNSGPDNTTLTPALGDVLSEACSDRVLLFRRDEERFAHLFKSATKPELQITSVQFQIIKDGIRDCPLPSDPGQ